LFWWWTPWSRWEFEWVSVSLLFIDWNKREREKEKVNQIDTHHSLFMNITNQCRWKQFGSSLQKSIQLH
jgi:hypothetical protein